MHKFFNTKITSGILTGLLIMLIVYSNHVDSRAISRKPPFNGSIFGKRSTIPANQGMEIYYASPQQPPAIINNKTSHVLASLLQQQQDASIRTAVNRCLAQYEITLEVGVMDVCERLLALLNNQSPSAKGNPDNILSSLLLNQIVS